MGYLSEEIGFDHADGKQHVLLLLEGNCCKGRHDPKASSLKQRSKTDYCPCCAVATMVTVPALYKWGTYSEEEALSLQMWQPHGPWAGRSYAAMPWAIPLRPHPAERMELGSRKPLHADASRSSCEK